MISDSCSDGKISGIATLLREIWQKYLNKKGNEDTVSYAMDPPPKGSLAASV
jgi:hypothetical protein